MYNKCTTYRIKTKREVSENFDWEKRKYFMIYFQEFW